MHQSWIDGDELLLEISMSLGCVPEVRLLELSRCSYAGKISMQFSGSFSFLATSPRT